MTELTVGGVGAAVTAFNDVREARRTEGMCECALWVIDTRASNGDIVASCMTNDLVDWLESSSFGEAEEAGSCN